jgi:hypothetical protein
MGSQDITHNPSFYFSIGAQVLVTLVLLGLVIVGIVVAIRAKTGRGKGCGIVMAVAFALQACLAAFFFLISFFAGLESNSSSQPRTLHAKDGSCEISVARSWVESPDLSSEGMLAAKDLTGSEYVVVYVHSKQDYVGNLNDFAQDHTDLVREKLKTPQVEAPVTSTENRPCARWCEVKSITCGSAIASPISRAKTISTGCSAGAWNQKPRGLRVTSTRSQNHSAKRK